MNNIVDKNSFIITASDFFNELFEPGFNSECGNIEIRTFKPATQSFCKSEMEAAEKAYQLCQKGIDVYYGVNPRIGNGGKKENVHYLSSFHAEIDYGTTGHKKSPLHNNYEETLTAIQTFNPEPTVIIHSGGGFHCYWVLSNPVKGSDIGISVLESINKALSFKLGGDIGTQDISRVLRVPGTFNFKIPDNPRPVTLISNTHQKYDYKNFEQFLSLAGASTNQNKVAIKVPETKPSGQSGSSIDIDQLPVSDRIKFLIKNGNDGTYVSRSEADMAVISALVNKGLSENEIKQIFSTHKIGEKYQSHTAPDKYLKHTIEEARKRSDLTEEELVDPLFISGALTKNNNKHSLSVLKFEEYLVKKYKIIILDQERAMFRYKDKCYEQFTDKALNKLCQDELKGHRNLFSKSSLTELIHYAIGDTLVDSEKVKNDMLNYLTMQNGLYQIDSGILFEHTPKIFTTNLLPFDYDPDAKCPRFMQFLDEVFQKDQDTISFVQEAVGYIFHKSIPTPAVFFLIGAGSNGKSVFINTISNLVGKENTSNVSFNLLSDETYILELYQKMVNISGETPRTKNIDTDVIKAVTAGDWVTGRELYKQPMKFRPFAKSFLAMNEPPSIKDTSHGMWRRIWVITFPRKFKENEMDRQLEYKLSLELSGIFNWALEGYSRLKGKDFALKESESMKLSKKVYRSSTDSTRDFIITSLTYSNNSDDRIKLSELYELYRKYCQSEGEENIKKKAEFRKALEGMNYKVDNSSKDGNQVYVFNVKLKPIVKEEKIEIIL
jgi:putative DNA primase/helicase